MKPLGNFERPHIEFTTENSVFYTIVEADFKGAGGQF